MTCEYELSRLNDAELQLLEQLLSKAAGEIVGDEVPTFRVEFINRNIESDVADEADAH
jgi:hypothetical protein